jgi:N-acetylglucosamine malate deacetylase 1
MVGDSMSPTALAILAHPDDAEFLCAGTLVRLRREHQFTLHVATMTPGDCGSAEQQPFEISRIRRAEGAAAAQAIGATYHCLEEPDLRVIYGERALEKVVKLLCEVRPSVVFTHSPDDYHMDHEQTSKIVRAATFAAPIPNFWQDGFGSISKTAPAPLAQIPHLFYCDPLEGKDLFGRLVPPSFRVDITSAISEKAAMLACHESQRAWLRKHHGVDNLVDSMKSWSASQGESVGVAFAEGFRQHLGHSYPQDNLLAKLLKAI